MNELNCRYFILVRLFKGWKDLLTSFEDCCKVYYSMRLEMRVMDYGDNSDLIQTRWKMLHEIIPLDTIYRILQPGQDVSFIKEKLPFDILVKSGLDRTELIKLNDKLRTVPPVNSDQTEQEEWVTEFRETLESFEEILNLPK